MLLELVRSLGPKLPQAWPYVLQIMVAVKAILGLLQGKERQPLKLGALPTHGKNLVKAAAKQGINEDEAREVAETLAALESAVKSKAKKK